MEDVVAQDIHLAQFESSPMTLNPALAGLFDGTHRFNLNNRMQWRSITTPYMTLAASFDMPIIVREYKRDIIGLGVNVFRDVAGDSKFGTTQLNYSLSYTKAIDKTNSNFLSIGLQNGVGQRSIDYAKLTFDSQYDGFKFDPTLETKESSGTTNFLYMDIGAGVNWRYQPLSKMLWNTGFSIMHINKPMHGFLNNDNVRLDRKITLYSFGLIPCGHDFDILPKVIYQRQGSFSEFLVGTAAKVTRRAKKNEYLAIYGGVYLRSRDAAVFMVGVDVLSLYVAVSYDVNYSGLVPASNMRGGIELALVYKLAKEKRTRQRAMPCPIF